MRDERVEATSAARSATTTCSVSASWTRQVAITVANTATGARGPNGSGATSASDTTTSSAVGAIGVS